MLSSTDIFAILRWWLALMSIGLAVTPLTFVLFRRLPDRGYTFTKMLGLLLVSYLFWILGSLGFIGNNLGGILFAFSLVTGFSSWMMSRHQAEMRAWLRENGRFILITELLFFAVLVFWAWARAQHPEISATEKPMEFAFLNSVTRTPTFPPIDPWLSGFAISYYYFGYVMVSLITRLAVVPTSLGFNLALAWVVASTAVGSFGLVYNLIASRGANFRKTAVLFGLIAAIAIPMAGNQEITLEVLHANRVGNDQFWQWLDVQDLNQPLPQIGSSPRYETSFWWWWRASRPINELSIGGNRGLEPIVEFPAFSFILGDIHPHVLVLPFALLSLGLAFVWFLESRELEIGGWGLGAGEQKQEAVHHSPFTIHRLQFTIKSLIPNWPLFIITILILGGLSFLNTWDVLIYTFVVLAAFALGQWQRRQVWHGVIVRQTAVLAVLILIPAIILYFPFYIGFSSQAGAPYLLPMLMRPTRLVQFLVVFSMPLLVLVVFLIGTLLRQRFQEFRVLGGTAVVTLTALILISLLFVLLLASSSAGAGIVINFANEASVTLSPRPPAEISLGWGLRTLFAILPAYISMKAQFFGTTLLLTLMLGAIVAITSHQFKQSEKPNGETENTAPSPLRSLAHSPLPFTLLLILTATLLTLGPEFLFLRDNFGARMNTIFKFYYQAWVMFGVAAVVAIEMMWQEWQTKLPSIATGIIYAVLLISALQFPVFAIQSRAIEYRGAVTAENRLPATLDGLAKLQIFNPDEYDAIRWLDENSEGLPVVLEATGEAYSSYGRVATNTGLPTVLGWANHEYQWRGSDTPEPAQRDTAIQQIYGNQFWDNTGSLLNQYQVEYIYVGDLEFSTYGNNGTLPSVEKFNSLLEVAYQNNSVTIYRWHPE